MANNYQGRDNLNTHQNLIKQHLSYQVMLQLVLQKNSRCVGWSNNRHIAGKKKSSTGANIAHNGGHNVETADSEITTDTEYG